jgi:hypothetical protein
MEKAGAIVLALTLTLVTAGQAVAQGLTVAADPCPPDAVCGACCFPDGSCTYVSGAECAANGGEFQGGDSFCDTFNDPCTPTGACCWEGGCDVETQEFCEDDLKGSYLGDDTVCPDTDGPCNDVCEGAFPVLVGSTIVGSTANASGDDVELCLPDCCPPEGGAPGVWFSVIGTGGPLVAATCNFNAESGNTVLVSVYCSCDDLTCVGLTELCIEAPSEAPEDLQTFLEWCSEAGVEYKILVQTPGYEGEFVLQVVQPTDAVECVPEVFCGEGTCGADHCEEAGEICPFETYVVDTSDATSDYIDHGGTVDDVFFCGNVFGVYDEWCKYTPDEDGDLFVHVEGPGTDGTEWVFGVYDDCPAGPGDLRACNTALHHGVLVCEVEAGRTYWIRMAARGFGRGECVLDIVGPPCGDLIPTAATHPCAADLDGDGAISIGDLQRLLRDTSPCRRGLDCPADLTGDGVVDAKDVTTLLARLGTDCPDGEGDLRAAK